MKGEDATLPLADHDLLVRRRKEELRHAQDIKQLYERKLKKVDELFVELNAWKLQLEEAERSLARRERQLSIQGSKIHYKKKLSRSFLGGGGGGGCGGGRFQPRAASRSLSAIGRKSSPSTPEVLSTSPESPPFKLPQQPSTAVAQLQQLQQVPLQLMPHGNAAITVRENPCFFYYGGSDDGGGVEHRKHNGVRWHRVRALGKHLARSLVAVVVVVHAEIGVHEA